MFGFEVGLGCVGWLLLWWFCVVVGFAFGFCWTGCVDCLILVWWKLFGLV